MTGVHQAHGPSQGEARAQQIRTGLAWLHAADPVLARVIDDHPGFDPDAWARRLPALGLFGALVFQVIGQQISVIAATAIFGRLTQRFGGRVPDAGELASVDQGTLSGCGFRIHAGAVIDLECLCGEELCPIGVPDTCAQASQLLSSQTSSLVVCEQASNGTCEQVGASDAGTSVNPSVSTCDRTCEGECAGEPDCIQLCGC